jgi:hypothetical protein
LEATVATSTAQGKPTKTVSLDKRGHRYILTYEVGDEVLAVSAIRDWETNPRLNFDAFDAAVMSHQVECLMADQLQ